MQHNNEQSQFFPPILKWVSIGFFAIILVSVAYVALNTSNSYEMALQTESGQAAQTPTIEQRHNSTPTSTTSASPTTSTQTDDTSNQSITPTHDLGNQRSSSTLGKMDSGISVSHPPVTLPTPQQKCDHQKPKGIIMVNKKIYFMKGIQGYEVIDRLIGPNNIHWLCNWKLAEKNGWEKASPSSYKSIQSLIQSIKNFDGLFR